MSDKDPMSPRQALEALSRIDGVLSRLQLSRADHGQLQRDVALLQNFVRTAAKPPETDQADD